MINTNRLTLYPFTHDQLLLYIKNDGSLETVLSLHPSEREMSSELAEALEQTILPHVADKMKDYLLCTLWTLILKSEKIMVGDFCFVDVPDINGNIEIGYGIYPAHRKQGYMTEAVAGVIEYLKKIENINSLLANTDKSNPASFNILIKNGFNKYAEDEELFKWSYDLKKNQ